MEITFTREDYYHYYSKKHEASICISSLAWLFELEDKPKEIDIVISETATPSSYHVTLWTYGAGFEIKLSNGNTARFPAEFAPSNEFYMSLPKSFYVSVKA